MFRPLSLAVTARRSCKILAVPRLHVLVNKHLISNGTMSRHEKNGGTGERTAELPPRLADLKATLWRDEMIQSWKGILHELESAVEEIATHTQDVSFLSREGVDVTYAAK